MLIAISTNMTNQPYLTRYRLIKGRQRLIYFHIWVIAKVNFMETNIIQGNSKLDSHHLDLGNYKRYEKV